MKLTADFIDMTILNIAGFIIAETVKETHRPLEVVMRDFLKSDTYSLLNDKETGLYWDSIPETLNMFLKEYIN